MWSQKLPQVNQVHHIIKKTSLTSMSFSAVVGEPVLERGGSSCLDPLRAAGGFSSCLHDKLQLINKILDKQFDINKKIKIIFIKYPNCSQAGLDSSAISVIRVCKR